MVLEVAKITRTRSSATALKLIGTTLLHVCGKLMKISHREFLLATILRLWMLRGLWRRLILRLILVRWRMRSGSLQGTTSTGSVWQEGMDLNTDPRLIRHYYTPPQGWRSMLDGPYPHEDREITLTTTWSGTATNPFTGETQTINGLVTTTETTGKFPLSHLVINNTDTWEERQGH